MRLSCPGRPSRSGGADRGADRGLPPALHPGGEHPAFGGRAVLPGTLSRASSAPLGIDSRGGSDVAPVGIMPPPARPSSPIREPHTTTETRPHYDPRPTTTATTIALTRRSWWPTVAPPVEPVPAPVAPPAPG